MCLPAAIITCAFSPVFDVSNLYEKNLGCSLLEGECRSARPGAAHFVQGEKKSPSDLGSSSSDAFVTKLIGM